MLYIFVSIYVFMTFKHMFSLNKKKKKKKKILIAIEGPLFAVQIRGVCLDKYFFSYFSIVMELIVRKLPYKFEQRRPRSSVYFTLYCDAL